jgi:hypothetical protein
MQIEERTLVQVGVERHGYSAKRMATYIGTEGQHDVGVNTNGVTTTGQKPTKDTPSHDDERVTVVRSHRSQTRRK